MLSDVSQISHEVNNDTIRLYPEDAISTKLWVDRLRSRNINMFYKDRTEISPLDSGLQHDAFVLFIQTEFQSNMFQSLGSRFIGINATHNITQYEDL